MVVGMYPVALKFSEINIVQMAFTDAAFQVFIRVIGKGCARSAHC